MNYQICTSGLPEELVEEVNKQIGDGWLPVGGVSVAINEYYAEDLDQRQVDTRSQIFVQAMVRPDKAEKKKILTGRFNG